MHDRHEERAHGPTVSCVIPARDAAVYIGDALESALLQTHRMLEILVVDDGSVDETVMAARRAGDFVTIISQPASGPASARNRGVEAASGSLIAFLDADDVWEPEKTAHQVAHFKQHPEVDACFCQVRPLWTDGIPDQGAQQQGPAIVHPITLMVRRETFAHVGQFDTTLRYNDWLDWMVRARRTGAVMQTVAKPLYVRRMHKGSMSRVEAAAARAELLGLTRRFAHETESR